MQIAVGIPAALWILLALAVIGAVLVGTLVLSIAQDILHGFQRQRSGSAPSITPLEADDQDFTIDDLGDAGDWVSYGWSETPPPEPTAWWWSPGGSAPETLVIDGGYRSSTSAVAHKRATRQNLAIDQIWTIHPDHTAHWQDEAGNCPWCRSEPQ